MIIALSLLFGNLFLLGNLAIGSIYAVLNLTVCMIPLVAFGAQNPRLAVHLRVIFPREVHLKAVVALLVRNVQIVAVLAQRKCGSSALILQLDLVKDRVFLFLVRLSCAETCSQSCLEGERAARSGWIFGDLALLILGSSRVRRSMVDTTQTSCLHFCIIGTKLVVTGLFNASEDCLVGRVSFLDLALPLFIVQITFSISYF